MSNFLGSGSFLEPNRVKQTARKSTGGRPPKPRSRGLFIISTSSEDENNRPSSNQRRNTPNHRNPPPSARPTSSPKPDMSGKQNPPAPPPLQNGQQTNPYTEPNGIKDDDDDDEMVMWSAPTSNVRGVDEVEVPGAMMAVASAPPAVNSTSSPLNTLSSPMPPKRSKCDRCRLMRSEPACEPTTSSKKCSKCYRDHRNCSWTSSTSSNVCQELSSATTTTTITTILTSTRKRKPSIKLSNNNNSDSRNDSSSSSSRSSPPPPLPKTPRRRRVKKDRRGQPRDINGKCVRCASFTNNPPCERSDDPNDPKCKKCRRDKQSCSFAPYNGRRKLEQAAMDDNDDNDDDETDDAARRDTNDEEEDQDQEEDQLSDERVSRLEKAREARYNRTKPPAVDTYETDWAKYVRKQLGDKAGVVARPAEKEVYRETKEMAEDISKLLERGREPIFSGRYPKSRERENANMEEMSKEKRKTEKAKSKEGQRDEGQRLKEGTAVEKATEGGKEKQKDRTEKQKTVVTAKNRGKEKEKTVNDKSEVASSKKRKEKERADESDATNSLKKKKRREDDHHPTKKHKSEANSASNSKGPSTKSTLSSPNKSRSLPRTDDLRAPASVQGVASSITQESEQSGEDNQPRSLQVVARELSAAEFKASSHRILADSFLRDAERADEEVARLKEEMVSIVRRKVDLGEMERNHLMDVLGSNRSEAS